MRFDCIALLDADTEAPDLDEGGQVLAPEQEAFVQLYVPNAHAEEVRSHVGLPLEVLEALEQQRSPLAGQVEGFQENLLVFSVLVVLNEAKLH